MISKNNNYKLLIKPYLNNSSLEFFRYIKDIARTVNAQLNYYKHKDKYKFRIIYISAGCRTASTWLAEVISLLLEGYNFYHPKIFPHITNGDNYDINESLLKEVNNKLYVIRGHTPVSELNLKNINKYFKKCICTFRDPRDIIVSIKLHLDQNLETSSFRDYGLSRTLPWETIKLDNYIALNDNERFELILEKILPAIKKMSNDWLSSAETNNYMIVRYEDLVTDSLNVINNIMIYYNLKISSENVKKVLGVLDPKKKNPVFTYFSKGKIGIWKDYLNDYQNQKIYQSCQSYMDQLGYEKL
jgi:hypothetical protein